MEQIARAEHYLVQEFVWESGHWDLVWVKVS